MKKCPHCSRSNSDEAIFCQFCGKELGTKPILVNNLPEPKPKARKYTGLKVFIILTLIGWICVGLIFLEDFIRDNGKQGAPRDTGFYSPTLAYMMCQDFIENNLKAPSTAKFPNSSEVQVSDLAGYEHAYHILGYVDSENSFGAMLRTYYTCDINYVGNDKWRLLDLEFDE